MYAGIETGGTKTVCAVGSEGRVFARVQFPTGTDPESLADQCAEFFADHPVTALGLGTFGPCDPDPDSPHTAISCRRPNRVGPAPTCSGCCPRGSPCQWR